MNYEAWRATFQSSEQAARSAYGDAEDYRIAEQHQIGLRQKVEKELDRHKRMFAEACATLGEIQTALGNGVAGIESVLVREVVDERNSLAAYQAELIRELTACQSVLHNLAHDGQVTPAYANEAKAVLKRAPKASLKALCAEQQQQGCLRVSEELRNGHIDWKKFGDHPREQAANVAILVGNQIIREDGGDS